MNVTRLAGRRLAIAASTSAAVILAGSAILAATTASAAPARPAIRQCVASNMTVWTGYPGDGAAGSTYYELQISNIGHHACTLYGYPGVSAVNSRGRRVGLPASHSGRRSRVVVPAHGTSHVVLQITDPGMVCPRHTVKATELKVYAPGQRRAELTPFQFRICPHAVTMRVDAVHAHAGVPGYSAS